MNRYNISNPTTSINVLSQALTNHKNEYDRINSHIIDVNDHIETLKKSKAEIEASIKDIELALSALRND